MTVSENTMAALLLCGRWDKGERSAEPLTPGDFNRVETTFSSSGNQLASLLYPDWADEIDDLPVSPERLKLLVGDAALMAIQVDEWLNNGMWISGRGEEGYPAAWIERLGEAAPPLIWGAGSKSLMDSGGVAIVGSRGVDEEGTLFTVKLGGACARAGLTVVSGGARGVDQTSMAAALEAGGQVVGVMSEGLARASVQGGKAEAIREGMLTLVSAYHPRAGFNVGNAMGRNKLIYAAADAAVVVSSDEGRGGTWSGATENLRKWKVPLFVRDVASPKGNRALLKKGASAFPEDALDDPSILLAGDSDAPEAGQTQLPF